MSQTRLFQEFILTKDDFIGYGSFGEVYKAQNKNDSQDYAIKIVKIRNKHEAESILQEVKNLAKLNHPNIIRYYNSWLEMAVFPCKNELEKKSLEEEIFCLSDEIKHLESYGYITPTESSQLTDCTENGMNLYFLCIQMELCENSLDKLIKEVQFSNEVLFEYAKQICEGMNHVHENNIIHRDLKPDNIFIGRDKNIKIGDFGLSKTVPNSFGPGFEEDPNGMSACGTKLYMAPEIKSKNYDQRVDLYSLGVIYLEMCYQFSTTQEFVQNLSKKKKDFSKLPIPFSDLIKRLLHKNPDIRPSCKDILTKYLLKHEELVFPRNMSQFDKKQQMIQKRHFIERNLSGIDLKNCEKNVSILKVAEHVFELHGGKNIPMPTFSSYMNLGKKAVKIWYRNPKCPVSVSFDSRIPFAQYVINEPYLNSIRRYSLGNIFENNFDHFIPNENQECSFDAVDKSCHSDNTITEAEVLFIAKHIIDEARIKNVEIIYHINDSRLIDKILEKLNVPDKTLLYNFLFNISGLNLTREKFRMELEAFQLSDDIVNKLTEFYPPKKLHEIPLNRNLPGIRYLRKLIKNLKQFGIDIENVFIAPLLLTPKLKYHGLNFKVYLRNEFEHSNIAFGGRYDRFVSRDPLNRFAVGISFDIENLIRFVDDNNQLTIAECRIISSNASQVIPIMKLLWSHNIKTSVAATKDILKYGLFILPSSSYEPDLVTVVLRTSSTQNKLIFKGSYKNEAFVITIKDHINAIEVIKLIT